MKKIQPLIFTLCPILFCFLFSSNVKGANMPEGLETIVVPDTYFTTPGPNVFLGPMANSPRTNQQLIHEDQLTDFVGKSIIAITWRLPTSATTDWPPIDALFGEYNVYLSESVHPSDRSLTFSQNIVGPQTQVRSGNLIIIEGSYRFGSFPNDFGPDVEFTTPWLYTGGHLLIEIRHSGSTTTSRSLDAVGTAVPPYGTLISACWGSGMGATSGSQGNFSIIRITADDLVGIINPYEIPTQYKLSQNYPNPFNPVTSIQFSIPQSEFVTLKVYNSLGQEVAILANERHTTGTYDYLFDAMGLTSGVYYYELQAGDFRETKRMMLIK